MQMTALPTERTLDNRWLLDELLRDGRITGDDADRIIRMPRFGEEAKLHPIEWIAAQTEANSASRPATGRLFSSQYWVIGTPRTSSITKYGRPEAVVPASKTLAMLG